MALLAPGNGAVWIVGASSGIGAALARRLAADGHVVAASARRAEALEDLAAEEGSGRIRSFPLDITDVTAAAETFAAVERDIGPVHTAVLGAGAYKAIPAGRFDAAEAARQIGVNLVGVTNALDPLLAAMLGRGRGHIALIGSLTSRFGLPQAGVYGATKAGLVNLAEALRVECRDRGVTVQVINPGFVATPLTEQNDFPMPFLVSQEKAAAIIAKGLAGDSFEIAFPWQMALATGLLRALPRGLAFAATRRMVRP